MLSRFCDGREGGRRTGCDRGEMRGQQYVSGRARGCRWQRRRKSSHQPLCQHVHLSRALLSRRRRTNCKPANHQRKCDLQVQLMARRGARLNWIGFALFEHLQRFLNRQHAQVGHRRRVDQRPRVIDQVVADQGRREHSGWRAQNGERSVQVYACMSATVKMLRHWC